MAAYGHRLRISRPESWLYPLMQTIWLSEKKSRRHRGRRHHVKLNKPEFRVKIDRERSAYLGVDTSDMPIVCA